MERACDDIGKVKIYKSHKTYRTENENNSVKLKAAKCLLTDRKKNAKNSVEL